MAHRQWTPSAVVVLVIVSVAAITVASIFITRYNDACQTPNHDAVRCHYG